ncbi:MAG TPA: 23S rRNA (adenine(2030)-N(6))-methyltransferase RlmJ [Steroidobacteraceae bacterium]|jgi:23S rRNA (adenine2030-N6)-methyltransferase|nr:23S rRNA (adenine(2030)-N(6))-methyltransferase RlmJ [Steroidobacteraceae bacterium]
MNYQHIYHAGNFADVAKHAALVFCLEALKRKQTGFFVLDTHAGRGRYDLGAGEAQRSGESARGILRLIEAAGREPVLRDYLAAVGAPQEGAADAVDGGRAGGGPGGGDRVAGGRAGGRAGGARGDGGRGEGGGRRRLAHYPGSPALIAGALRSQDRALLVEMQPAEARALERQIESTARLGVQLGDGYAALKSQLPPRERRGLVLIDPPYEDPGEIDTVLAAFADAYRRWPTGMFLIWYPILNAAQRAGVHARFKTLGIPKMLGADLAVHPDDAHVGLAGSGLLIVNPPYGADEHLREGYAAIHRALAARGAGYAEVARLTPEQMAQ